MESLTTNQTEQRSEEVVEPLSLERNSIILEDWFAKVEWTGKLAAVLLFNLLTSSCQRHQDIGRHILKNLYENIEETEGLTSQEDMFVRELLFAIAERPMKIGA